MVTRSVSEAFCITLFLAYASGYHCTQSGAVQFINGQFSTTHGFGLRVADLVLCKQYVLRRSPIILSP